MQSKRDYFLPAMVMSSAKTVEQYLSDLPSDRQKALRAVRKVIRKNLPKGYVESINWGMIVYEIPLKRYPTTYNNQPLMYAALASQKNYMSVYLTNIQMDGALEKEFIEEYMASGKKLDMGKSCIRFKKIDDIPLELIGKCVSCTSVSEYIAQYEKTRNR